MKIIRTFWFAGMYGFCGILLGKDSITGEKRAYIGPHLGQDEACDQRLIADGGAHLPLETVKAICEFLEVKED